MLFQPCSALNEELALFRKRYPKQPLSSAPTFAKTSAALLLPVFASQPDSQKGMTLNHQLIDALPDIARRCQEQPARMYSSVLPKDLQRPSAYRVVKAASIASDSILISHECSACSYRT